MSTFVYLHVLCTKKLFSYLFTCLRRDIQSLEVSITQHLASPFLSAYLSLFICSSLMSAYLWILFLSKIFPSSNIILVNDNSVNTENFPQVRNLCLMVVTKKRLSFTRWLGIQYFLHLLHWIICSLSASFYWQPGAQPPEANGSYLEEGNSKYAL